MTDEVHDLQRQWEWLLKHYPFPEIGDVTLILILLPALPSSPELQALSFQRTRKNTQGCSIISATRWARMLREEILAGAGRTPSTTKTGKNANG
jgi:hypothetical protein